MIFGSAWAEEVTMKYTGTETSNMLADGSNEAATVGLEASAWSVVADKGSASNAPGLNKAGDIRLYYNAGGSNTIEVKSLTNATIKKIAITFTDAQYSNVSVTVNGNAVTGTDGVFEINNPSFVLGNGNTSNVQVRISQIVISYEGGAPIDVLAPKFSVSSGTYYTPQTVAMSCETEGAKILYTIPAGQDPVYVDDSNYTGVFYDGNPLTISQTTTIKAMAVKNGKTSSISTAVYTIKQLEEVNVAKAVEIVNALENGKTTEDVYQVKGIIVGTPDFQRDKEEKLYGNVNFTMSDGDGSTALLTVFRAKDLENKNFTEETINRIKEGDKVVVQGKLQKYVKDEVVTPELTSGYLISVNAGETTADTWTVAGTLPLTDKAWDPTDPNGDMMPNGNGEGVSSYERNNIVLEKGVDYKFKVVKNHSWDEAYPAQDYIIKVDETAKYHVKIFFNTTTHEITYEINKTGEAGTVEHTYSVIGTLVGDWDTDTDMTKGTDGLYTAVFENVAAGRYEFKVRADKAWSVAYPVNNYVLTVDNDKSTVTITFNEETKEVKAEVTQATQWNVVYDFTSWKTSTVSALVADAAASKTSGWSDVEKAADAEAGADPTEASKNNCFWCVAEPNEDGTLSANGEVIEELKGLKWNKAYTVKRSLAIAVNYPTALSDYAGPAYLWLGGGKNKIPCFTIPGVKAGSTVTMEVESHKASDARGVELYTGVDADGLVDAATKIGDSFTPTTKDSHTWTIDADCDVIVYNTNGCHIYSIKVEAGSTGISTVNAQKTQNNVIYNLAGQKVGNDYKGIVIMNGKKFMQK
jgi:hypothetical protein